MIPLIIINIVIHKNETMKQFLKFTLAAAAGLMLGVFSIIIIFSILAASGDSKEVQLDKPYVLRLELNGEIQDRVEEMPFDLSEITGQDVNILGLNDILANIKKAKQTKILRDIYRNRHDKCWFCYQGGD